MATTTNYSGRSVDLLIFQNTAPAGEKQIYLGFGTGGELTTGIQKVAQTFTALFLTEVGTVFSQPTLGTDFLTLMRQGALRTESDVQSSFALAAQKVKNVMVQEAIDEELPDDETVSEITLQSYRLDTVTGTLVLYVRLTTVAGANREIYLPVSVPMR